eukprot:gene5206-biopygen10192
MEGITENHGKKPEGVVEENPGAKSRLTSRSAPPLPTFRGLCSTIGETPRVSRDCNALGTRLWFFVKHDPSAGECGTPGVTGQPLATPAPCPRHARAQHTRPLPFSPFWTRGAAEGSRSRNGARSSSARARACVTEGRRPAARRIAWARAFRAGRPRWKAALVSHPCRVGQCIQRANKTRCGGFHYHSVEGGAAGPAGCTPWIWEKRLRTRPGRVRFFKFYRPGRVRDASAAVSPYASRKSGGSAPPHPHRIGRVRDATRWSMERAKFDIVKTIAPGRVSAKKNEPRNAHPSSCGSGKATGCPPPPGDRVGRAGMTGPAGLVGLSGPSYTKHIVWQKPGLPSLARAWGCTAAAPHHHHHTQPALRIELEVGARDVSHERRMLPRCLAPPPGMLEQKVILWRGELWRHRRLVCVRASAAPQAGPQAGVHPAACTEQVPLGRLWTRAGWRREG